MKTIDRLSTSMGVRGNAPNKELALCCLKDPLLLQNLRPALLIYKKEITADAAEVFTEVALQKPELVSPFFNDLFPLLKCKDNRARWEAMHAISAITFLNVELMRPLLPELERLVQEDKSIIVRDYVIEAIGNYSGVSLLCAKEALPYLEKFLSLENGRFAGKCIFAMMQCAVFLPANAQLEKIANNYSLHEKASVQKAARKLLRILTQNNV